jgi:ParB-like chromosome segregation protein Spo0J
VYAGNMRLRAAQRLGLAAVPAILAPASAELVRQRLLRDNSQWGDWEEEALAELVYTLQQQDGDLATLGFTARELERLLDSVGEGEEHLEGLPDLAPPSLVQCPRCGHTWEQGASS